MTCCVPFCNSNKQRKDKLFSSTRISFHEFPVDQNLSRQWLRRIARKDFAPNALSGHSVVCSKHFTPDDFVPNAKKRNLKKGTIPTIFPMYPSYALLPPPKSSPSLASLNHDHVKKPPIRKFERKNVKKQIDPAILYNFEMKSSPYSKSAVQHDEDRVFIKEEKIEEDANSSESQTLNHLKRLPTEISKKRPATTSIASNSKITCTDNNSPNMQRANLKDVYCPDIEFYSNILSTNNNPSVHVPTFNEEISFIRVNENGTPNINDGSGTLFNSDIISTNNNLPEQSCGEYMASISAAKQDYPAANNYHSLVSFNHQKSLPVSETEHFTVTNGASMDFNSGMTLTNNNSSKLPSVVGVCPTNVAKKSLPAKSKNHALVSINCIKTLPTAKTKIHTINDTVNSDMTSQNESLEDQEKVSPLPILDDSLHRSVVDKSKEIQRLRSQLREKNQELEKMKEKMDKLEEKVSVCESNHHHEALGKISAENSPQSNWFLDQTVNFFRKHPSWRKSTIRECATWVACSPTGYDFVRDRKLMVLPSRKTLQRYAYSGEQKVDFCNLGPCQEASLGKSETEN